MHTPKIWYLAVICVAVVTSARTAHAQTGSGLPTCSGWNDCNPGKTICTFAGQQVYQGPTTVSDLPDGVSSDGRGPYIKGIDGVEWSIIVLGNAGLSLAFNKDSIKHPRTFSVNLDRPVGGSGSTPLGLVTSGNDDHLYTAWRRDGNVSMSLHDIPVGQTVPAGQMNVSIHSGGRFLVLQMGPLPLGNCHMGADSTRVTGVGTSSGNIYRASQTKWVMDLPAGSVGRLFDLSHTTQHAVDLGLYYIRLHYEIGQ